MKPNIVVLSTSPNLNSKSRAAAELMVKCLNRHGIPTEFVDIRELPPLWVTGGGLAAAGAEWEELGAKVEQACTVIFAAPVYCYTVGSPARVAVELLSSMLAGKPIALITAAGSPRSMLAHRDFLNSLSDEVNAQILPKTVQVTGSDFDEAGHLKDEIRDRIEALADLVVKATFAYVDQPEAREIARVEL